MATTTASLNFISVAASGLDSIPVTDGQIIFVRDSRKIYVDAAGSRVAYDGVNIDEVTAEVIAKLTATKITTMAPEVSDEGVLSFTSSEYNVVTK